MAEGSDLEKTEQPTSKKLEEAKKKGQVAKSVDLIHATTLCSFLIAVILFGDHFYEGTTDTIKDMIAMTASMSDITQADSVKILHDILYRVITIAGPIGAVLSITLVSITTLQSGISFAPQRLAFNLDRINPIKGIGKLFKLRSLVTLLTSLLKITAIVGVLFFSVKASLPLVANLGETDLELGLMTGGEIVLKTILQVTLVILVIATLDFIYQRWQHSKDLMMSKQEVKDENKTAEGDPKLKSRIRSMQRSIATGQMLEDVAEADVIVTNPHRIAVALKYRKDDDLAPIVLAKGMNLIAKKIRHIARKNGIPIIENKPLARALYSTVDVGGTIPEKLYQAVAEVLAFVHRIREQRQS